MAGLVTLSLAARNTRLQSLADLINVGGNGSNPAKLRIYDGTRPASPDVAVTDQNLLMEINCAFPFEASVSSGLLTADTMSQGIALLAGTASWGRIINGGSQAVLDSPVSQTGGGTAIELSQIAFLPGILVQVTSATFSEP